MPQFGSVSRSRLETAHPLLQHLFEQVVEVYDCSVLCGHRDKEDQEQAVREGRSKVHWPDGNHNAYPSNAVDVAPYPIDWNNTIRFYHFAGFVQGMARHLGIGIRWGGDWDRDYDLNDQSFNDLVHFEIYTHSGEG